MTGSGPTRRIVLLLATLTAAAGLLSARAQPSGEPPDPGPGPARVFQAPAAGDAAEFPVPMKPLPKTITPCRACHGPEKDFQINWTREEGLRVHTHIRLNHGGNKVWCLDCHSPLERNYLRPLSDGRLIPFEQSHELCGKCHGTKYRDWRHGIHGKRTGNWNGDKTYALCTQCHDPHSPRFRPIQPLPPPAKPRWPQETAHHP